MVEAEFIEEGLERADLDHDDRFFQGRLLGVFGDAIDVQAVGAVDGVGHLRIFASDGAKLGQIVVGPAEDGAFGDGRGTAGLAGFGGCGVRFDEEAVPVAAFLEEKGVGVGFAVGRADVDENTVALSE